VELYLLYPENEKYIAGQAKYPASIDKPSGCNVLFALIFVLAGLMPLSFGLNMLRENILLSQEALIVQGRIINRYIDDDDDGTTYHVVFEYVANDRRYEQRQQVGESEYGRYERGLVVDVEYSPSDPSVARLAGTNTWVFTFFLLGFAVLWMLFSGFFLAGMVNENRKRRALLENGRRLQGKLLSLSVDDRGEDTDTVVTVAFRTPNARVIQAERRYTTNRGLLHPPPAEAALAIFYMDDDHWEVL
jgi:hypothetical protein